MENFDSDNQNGQETETLQSIETHLEKIMMDLPQDVSPELHKQYLAGYIDCLCECDKISEEEREKLYITYVS